MVKAIVPLPWVVQAPRLFAVRCFGGRTPTAIGAFGEISIHIVVFRNTTTPSRLPRGHHPFARLVDSNDQGRRPARGADPAHRRRVGDSTRSSADNPDGDNRWSIRWTVRLEPVSRCDHRAVGCRQDPLLRSLANCWPSRVGDSAPGPDGDTRRVLVVSCPMCRLGCLGTWWCYPAAGRHLGRVRCATLLTGVALATLIDRLDEIGDCAKVLSPVSKTSGLRADSVEQPKAGLPHETRRRSTKGSSTRCTVAQERITRNCVVVSVIIPIGRPLSLYPAKTLKRSAAPWRLGPVSREPAPV